MKRSLLPLALLLVFLTTTLAARTLEVRSGGTYTNLEAAAAAVAPGDTILFRGGVYAGGQFVDRLQGAPGAPITIMGAPGEEVFIRGGSNAWHLSDPAWLVISGFIFEGQTGNGVNIDDGGSYDTPAHHLIFQQCWWKDIAATGNNDLLKLSGLDSFEVHGCSFRNGAAGGSMIDMVGCHNGLFTGNYFEQAGSNCIQAKGGTRHITIARNTFVQGGARAINIGGSTGMEFFRPLGVNYESSDIHVYSNLFTGSDAPVAFVGTVNSDVVNNTIWMPNRWAMRILQETTAEGFLQCGDNVFRNNIVVVGSSAASPTINVGPNTRPATFTFSNNLWFNVDNANWNGPSFPAPESNGIIGPNPMLQNPQVEAMPRTGSPAIGAGYPVLEPQLDLHGRPFATPRSIGAVEGGLIAGVAARGEAPEDVKLEVVVGTGSAEARFTLSHAGEVGAALYDVQGALRWRTTQSGTAGPGSIRIPLDEIPPGLYLCVVETEDGMRSRPIAVGR